MIPYTCVRCGYKTKNKTNIHKHLYQRKVFCPAKNDIELTEEIKDKIMKDRIYHIPKKTNNKNDNKTDNKEVKIDKNPIEILSNTNEFHYIYLIRCKEHFRHNENIYKVGKTMIKELTINLKRLIGYGKGTELLLIKRCLNSSIIENMILEEFNKKFTKYELGREYFIGNVNEMVETIDNIINTDYKNYKNL